MTELFASPLHQGPKGEPILKCPYISPLSLSKIAAEPACPGTEEGLRLGQEQPDIKGASGMSWGPPLVMLDRESLWPLSCEHGTYWSLSKGEE